MKSLETVVTGLLACVLVTACNGQQLACDSTTALDKVKNLVVDSAQLREYVALELSIADMDPKQQALAGTDRSKLVALVRAKVLDGIAYDQGGAVVLFKDDYQLKCSTPYRYTMKFPTQLKDLNPTLLGKVVAVDLMVDYTIRPRSDGQAQIDVDKVRRGAVRDIK